MKRMLLSVICLGLSSLFLLCACTDLQYLSSAPSTPSAPSAPASSPSEPPNDPFPPFPLISPSEPSVKEVPSEPSPRYSTEWFLWLREFGYDRYTPALIADVVTQSYSDEMAPSGFTVFTPADHPEDARFQLSVSVSSAEFAGNEESNGLPIQPWKIFYRPEGSNEPFESVTLNPCRGYVQGDNYVFELCLTDCDAVFSLKEDGSAQSYQTFFVLTSDHGTDIDLWWEEQLIWNESSEAYYKDALKKGLILPRKETSLPFEGGVAYAGYCDREQLPSDLAVSGGAPSPAQGSPILPLFRIDDLQELNTFKNALPPNVSTEEGHDEVPSFSELTKGYDDGFFEQYSLFIVYRDSGSGSLRYAPEGAYLEEGSLLLTVKQTNNPEIVTDDMVGWWVTFTIQKSDLSNILYLNAAASR